MRPDWGSPGGVGLDYGSDTAHGVDEALRGAEQRMGGRALTAYHLQPLLDKLLSMRDSDGQVKETTTDKLQGLEKFLKEAINEVHVETRSRRRPGRGDEKHIRRPGSLVLAPILDKLKDGSMAVSNEARISTPRGPIITKLKPQVIIFPMKYGAITAPIGSRQKRTISKEDIRRNPRFKTQHLRLVASGQRYRDGPDELATIAVTGGSLAVLDSSILDAETLSYTRYQDIEDCYSGSRIAPGSIEQLATFLFENCVEKLRVLVEGHGLAMKTTVQISGTPTDSEVVKGKLSFSELEVDELVRKDKRMKHKLKKRTSWAGETDEDSADEESPLADEDRELEESALSDGQIKMQHGLGTAQSSEHSTSYAPAPGSDTRAAGYLQKVYMSNTGKRALDEHSVEADRIDKDEDEAKERSKAAKRQKMSVDDSTTICQKQEVRQTGEQAPVGTYNSERQPYETGGNRRQQYPGDGDTAHSSQVPHVQPGPGSRANQQSSGEVPRFHAGQGDDLEDRAYQEVGYRGLEQLPEATRRATDSSGFVRPRQLTSDDRQKNSEEDRDNERSKSYSSANQQDRNSSKYPERDEYSKPRRLSAPVLGNASGVARNVTQLGPEDLMSPDHASRNHGGGGSRSGYRNGSGSQGRRSSGGWTNRFYGGDRSGQGGDRR